MEGIKRPEILKTDTEENFRISLAKARHFLLREGVVAFPTESFYGLGVNAMDEKSIKRLFTIKNRADNNPILILIPSLESLHRYVMEIPLIATRLMDQFWPGGLTLIFNAGKTVSPLLTSGSGKIGIRLSSHPVATALAEAIDGPITGTSANISGYPPCILAEEVRESLGHELDAILDGGETNGGKGSTILDVTVTPPAILREGMILWKDLESLLTRIN